MKTILVNLTSASSYMSSGWGILWKICSPLVVQAMGVKYSMDCSLFDKKIILGSIILQTILIMFRGGAIEYLLFLGNGC